MSIDTIISRLVLTAAEDLRGKVGYAVRLASASTVELVDNATQATNQALSNQVGVLVTDGNIGESVTVAMGGELVYAVAGTGGVAMNDALVAEASTGKLIAITEANPGDTIIGYATQAIAADASGLVRCRPAKVAAVPAIGASATIDMADAAVLLTASQIAANNVLLVDPNSGGASEALQLPTAANLIAGPLASETTKDLTIVNTGGEGIVLTTHTGLTLQSNPASGGATIAAGLAASIRLVKVSGSAVRVLITQHLTPS